MSDIETVLWALPRVYSACRTRRPIGGGGRGAVSEHQARILGYLDDVDPTMVTELADHMGVTASTMSLNLKRLLEAGLITKGRDPADRRVVNVRLTEAGAVVRSELSALDPGRIDALLRRLEPEGRRAAIGGLRRLAQAADALPALLATGTDGGGS